MCDSTRPPLLPSPPLSPDSLQLHPHLYIFYSEVILTLQLSNIIQSINANHFLCFLFFFTKLNKLQKNVMLLLKTFKQQKRRYVCGSEQKE